jgi:tetratricopeptide (TPR) repeat protein
VDNKTVSLHRLVHVATRNWLRSGETLEQWTVHTRKRLKDIFPSNEHKNRTLWREYLPHALFILQSKELQDDQQDREHLAYQVAKCLFSDGRYVQAGALFKEVFEKQSKRLKNDDEGILTSMAWLASTYQKLGRWMEAENLDVSVITTRKTVLGPEHPDTLACMNNLAFTYLEQGRYGRRKSCLCK